MTDDHRKNIQSIAPIRSLSQSSSLTAVESITKQVQPIEDTQTIESVSAIEMPTSVEYVDSLSSVAQLFDELISLHKDQLQEIALQVVNGQLTESQGEIHLLKLALTHSLNIPPLIAESMLPDLKASLDDLPHLRLGLRKLWQS